LDTKILDILGLPLFSFARVHLAGRRLIVERGPRRQGSRNSHHLTVCKNSRSWREQFCRFGVFSKAGYPPAPNSRLHGARLW
jgi:hypothetical protein